LFYVGKSVAAPQPADVLHAPVFLTMCLLSSSVTVHAGVKALTKGNVAVWGSFTGRID
jgi:cytochrome c oxidase subunit 3